jgi:hypothetical protein
MIEPYDDWMELVSVSERIKIQRRFFTRLRRIIRLGDTVVIHAGRAYYEPFLREALRSEGVVVDCPTEGLTSLGTFSELKRLLAVHCA